MLREEKNEKGVRKKTKRVREREMRKGDSNDYIMGKINLKNGSLGREKRWKKEK